MEILFLIFVFLTLAFDIVIYSDLCYLIDNTLDIDKELRRIKKGGKR